MPLLAGAAGLEPAVHGFKVRCLANLATPHHNHYYTATLKLSNCGRAPDCVDDSTLPMPSPSYHNLPQSWRCHAVWTRRIGWLMGTGRGDSGASSVWGERYPGAAFRAATYRRASNYEPPGAVSPRPGVSFCGDGQWQATGTCPTAVSGRPASDRRCVSEGRQVTLDDLAGRAYRLLKSSPTRQSEHYCIMPLRGVTVGGPPVHHILEPLARCQRLVIRGEGAEAPGNAQN